MLLKLQTFWLTIKAFNSVLVRLPFQPARASSSNKTCTERIKPCISCQLKCYNRRGACSQSHSHSRRIYRLMILNKMGETNQIRNWVMPINRKCNLRLLRGTLREELRFKHDYMVLLEYVMPSGVNDSIDDAKRAIELVQGIQCKINLLSFNPHCGSQFMPTKEEKMIEFRNVLAEAGCAVFLRISRGDDRMAACGQLVKSGVIHAPLLKVPAKFQAALEAVA